MLVGKQNGAVTLENNLAVSYKTKTKELKTYVYTKTSKQMLITAFIHNSPNLEGTKMRFSRCMDE